MKIWFQNRRSKVKKLVRRSNVTAAGDDDVKTDQLSSGGSAELADDDDDDHGVIDNKPTEFSSSPSPASQHHQQLGHRPSSWDDVPSSFQRFPALSQLHYSYPLSSSDDLRLPAVDCSTTSSWRTDSYSSSVNRLHAPYPGDSSTASSDMVTAQRLRGATVQQWYSTQTLLT